eukprot:6051733-Prymnesium_polylepis.2
MARPRRRSSSSAGTAATARRATSRSTCTRSTSTPGRGPRLSASRACRPSRAPTTRSASPTTCERRRAARRAAPRHAPPPGRVHGHDGRSGPSERARLWSSASRLRADLHSTVRTTGGDSLRRGGRRGGRASGARARARKGQPRVDRCW